MAYNNPQHKYGGGDGIPLQHMPAPPPGHNPQNYPLPGQPITNQPGAQQDGGMWMVMPQAPRNCPPGLEYLSTLDQLLVHEKVSLLEAFTGFETKNKFVVANSLGQKVYFAGEESDCCTRQCCGPARPFDMLVMDNFQNEVIHMYRPLKCMSCCCFCCLQTMEVSSPPGTVIGTVEQQWSLIYPSFCIRDETGEVVLRIKGPFCTSSICCNDVAFKVMTADGNEELGRITKQWSGFIKEAYTSADNFGITFPMNLDVKIKAVLLGACFLIDAMYFAHNN